MTMVIDTQGRHYGGMSYDPMYPATMHTSPQFSDPWSHSTSSNASSFPSLSKTDGLRTGMSMPYSHMTSAPTNMTSGSNLSNLGYGAESLSLPQDIPRSSYDQQYGTPATANSYSGSYSNMNGYAQSLHQQQHQQQQHRRLSETTDNSRAATASFADLDASRGMLALSHQNMQDMTPRNLYEARQQRSSTDSYGFPPSASGHSSLSNESGRGYPYYASSIASIGDSATDYSSAASDAGYDSIANSRTLPRPSQLMGAPMGPPAPQTMMNTFSSKLSANTQKKHKCKVCDKRFTRPSSLQTHMYSHTGEKPFACDVEGCGRHFSVVSNLRRHKKVHKGEATSPHSDNDD